MIVRASHLAPEYQGSEIERLMKVKKWKEKQRRHSRHPGKGS